MNALFSFGQQGTHLVNNLGWLLLHSLWQFAVIALVMVVVLRCLRNRSATRRYQVLLVALAGMMLSPPVTWYCLPGAPAQTPRAHLAAPPTGSVSPALRGDEHRPSGGSLETPVEAIPVLAPATIVPPGTSPTASPVPSTSWQQRVAAALEPWLPAVVITWLLGVLVCSLRPLIGWYTVRRLRRIGVSPVSAEIQALFRTTAQRLGIPAGVRILQSVLVQGPVVVGYFQPLVLLPASLLGEIPVSQIEAILAHELAHVRRFDYAVNLLQAWIETIFFYHPAVWWLSKQIRIEREHCCDDLVVSTLDNRHDYGRALLAITELRANHSTLAVGASGSPLLARVRRLCGMEPAERSWASVVASLLILGVGLSLTALVWQAVADEDNESPKSVRLTMRDANGKSLPGPLQLHLAHAGFPQSEKDQRVFTSDAEGNFELTELTKGLHTLVVAPADGLRTTILSLNMPAAAESIERRLSVPQRATTMPEARFQVSSQVPRGVIQVQLSNDKAAPFTLRDSDLCFTSENWRVFLPSSLAAGGKVVKRGQPLGLTLDWTTMVLHGHWLSRSGEDIDEPWPAQPPAEGNEHFRAFVGNSGSKTFELPSPQRVLARIAAQRLATSAIVLPKATYFLGEHIPLHYVVKNGGPVPIHVNWGGDSRAPRPLRFKIVAVGNRTRVEDPFPSPWCMGGLGSTQAVPPGQSYDMGELSLQRYCRFTRPGKYLLRAYHDLGWERLDMYAQDSPIALEKNEIPAEPRLAPVASGTIEIQVPDQQQARQVIREMREQNRDRSYAHDVFSGLQINAYLPALEEWIDENGGVLGDEEKRRRSGITCLPATTGIGSIYTPEATALLLKLARHKNPEVAYDALQQLVERLPNPRLERQRNETPALALRHRLSQLTWDERLRAPLVALGFGRLASANEHPLAEGEWERVRKNQMLACGILQSVARQDDYPKLRDQADQVARGYLESADEQNAYPRPQTVTAALIEALWNSFCNGKTEYSPDHQQRDAVFNTEDLDRLFATQQLDPFTTARLLGQVATFRPTGWRAWVKRQLRSDIPWLRAHTLTNLPRPADPAFRGEIALNITNFRRAVQAEAIAVATESPSRDYIPALRRAAKEADPWTGPLAEEALKACLAVNEEEVDDDETHRDETAGADKQLFNRLEARFSNPFANQVPTHVVIQGSGKVYYRSQADERLRVKSYESKFQLSAEALDQLVAALEKSNWLQTVIEKEQQPPRGHPTSYQLSLARRDELHRIELEDGRQKELLAYRELLHFLARLHRQEDTLRQLDPEAPNRETALLYLNDELKVLHGHRNRQPPALPIVDWQRFVPPLRATLKERETPRRSDLIAALRLFGLLRDPDAWDDIVWHYRDGRQFSKNLSSPVRDALVDAIVAYGGKQAVDLLVSESRDFHVSAWGLIRCGDVAVPAIVKIIDQGPGADRDSRFETMFRSYLTHWNELPGPIDARVVEAVRRSMDDPVVKKYRTQHHREFLDKVAAEQQAAWGEPVEGVSAHLGATRTAWPMGYAVKVLADIRNQGPNDVRLIRAAVAHRLEVDNVLYHAVGGGGKSSVLAPGQSFANLEAELTQRWKSVEGNKPLSLGLGKHTLRFHFQVAGQQAERAVISNPLEIHIQRALSLQEAKQKEEETRLRNAAAEEAARRALQKALDKPRDR